jgi:tryptophan halogenase
MSRKKKVSIIGAGNAGCITAMNYYLYAKDEIDTITIYHDQNIPIERTGQGTALGVASLINEFFHLDFLDHNLIKSTRKDGIMYENWGKKDEKIFNSFPQFLSAIHYTPNLFSQEVLNSGVFEVVEKNIEDPEKEIDSDFIFDCRGRNNREKDLYDQLVNPLNSVILSRKEEVYPDLTYTRTVATPNGWTFVIPNIDSTSYGYLYNNQITTKEEATADFIERFDVVPDGHLIFENYLAKNCFYGERTILNGNRLSFLEPLEATSTEFYEKVAMVALGHISRGVDKEICNGSIRFEMSQIKNFILWHYQFGSKFDTPFWEYAKSLPFNPDSHFEKIVDYSKKYSCSDLIRQRQRDKKELSECGLYDYGPWTTYNFKIWADGVGLT